jgi:hypothetical protein
MPEDAGRGRGAQRSLLTDAGQDTLRRAAKASDDAEREFFAPLSPQAARQLRDSLQTIVTHPDSA